MAKKSQSKDATRLKAQQMREAQEKSDQRTRNIIIALVSVLIIAIVVVIVVVVVNRPTPEKAAQGLPEQFQDGQPIIVSSEGVGVANPDAGDLTLYFDYTCGACAQLEMALRPDLIDSAVAGDYNLELQPVITAGAPYNVAATAGALVVAAEAPDLFIEFHDALVEYFYDAASAEDSSVYSNLDASAEKVAEIAREIGVSEDLIAQFDTDAAAGYLAGTTNTWVEADIQGRTQVATPEFVVDNQSLTLTGASAEEVIAELKAAVAAGGAGAGTPAETEQSE